MNEQPDRYYDTEVVAVFHASVVAPDQNSAVGQVKKVLYPLFPASVDNITVTLAEFKPITVVEHVIPAYKPGWIVKLFQDTPDVTTDDGNKVITVPAGSIGMIVGIRPNKPRPVTIKWFNLNCRTECDYPEFESYGKRDNLTPDS